MKITLFCVPTYLKERLYIYATSGDLRLGMETKELKNGFLFVQFLMHWYEGRILRRPRDQLSGEYSLLYNHAWIGSKTIKKHRRPKGYFCYRQLPKIQNCMGHLSVV